MNKLKSSAPALLIVPILALALALRLTGVNWDNDSRLHPDERFMTDVAGRIGNADNLIDEARERCQDQEAVYSYFNTDCSVQLFAAPTAGRAHIRRFSRTVSEAKTSRPAGT